MANIKRLSVTNKNYSERDKETSRKENIRRVTIENILKKDSYSEMLEGVGKVLYWALEDLKGLHKDIQGLGIKNGIPQAEVNKHAKTMMKARNFIDAYKRIMEKIENTYLNSNEKEEQALANMANEILTAMRRLDSAYIDQSITLVKELFRPFFGDKRTITFDGQTVTLDELVEKSPTDIGFMDLWVYSLGNSNSEMLRIVDYLIKDKKNRARLRTTNDYKELKDAHFELEKAGVKNTEFAYEKVFKGTKDSKELKDGETVFTGNLKQDRNYESYYKAHKEKIKELQNIVTTDPDVVAEKIAEMDKWETENTEKINGRVVPKRSLYPSKDYEDMNDVQRRYLDTVINIK
jgi:hypothetical protein